MVGAAAQMTPMGSRAAQVLTSDPDRRARRSAGMGVHAPLWVFTDKKEEKGSERLIFDGVFVHLCAPVIIFFCVLFLFYL